MYFSTADILRDMNYRRKQIGLSELQENPLLQRIALSKVRHMVDFQYVGHETLDGKNIFSFVDEKNKKIIFSAWRKCGWWNQGKFYKNYTNRYLLRRHMQRP